MNEEQRNKIADKSRVNAEIDSVKQYLDLYAKTDKKDHADNEKRLAQKHEKELHKAKMFSVGNLTNMITLSTILQKGGELP